MTDALGREIAYMRISITDRCNLRCKYCMPEDLPSLGHERILRYEEILQVCRVAVALGIREFRVTGGEPLVRKGCVGFLRELRAIPGVRRVSITTNGVLLAPLAAELAEIGVDGVNISLDTLDAAAYRRLTGQDALGQVLRAIEASVEAGLAVKLNCIPMQEVNRDEFADLAALAERQPVDVRFIELMPTDAFPAFHGIASEAVLAALRERYPDLHAVEERGAGPARYLRSARLRGRIGVIDAMTGHFCGGCNRVRLTSDGFLKLCLYHEDGVALREQLRGGIGDAALAQLLAQAIYAKPAQHCFAEGGIRHMWGIGG